MADSLFPLVRTLSTTVKIVTAGPNARRKLRKEVRKLSEGLEMYPLKRGQRRPSIASLPCGIGESQARLRIMLKCPHGVAIWHTPCVHGDGDHLMASTSQTAWNTVKGMAYGRFFETSGRAPRSGSAPRGLACGPQP